MYCCRTANVSVFYTVAIETTGDRDLEVESVEILLFLRLRRSLLSSVGGPVNTTVFTDFSNNPCDEHYYMPPSSVASLYQVRIQNIFTD